MKTNTTEKFWPLEYVLPSEHARLTALCDYLTGDSAVAEDLAQETLIEAWRLQHRLHNPAGYRQWLSAIARNICLRWSRAHQRELAHVLQLDQEEQIDILENVVPDALDLELELERGELAQLLDRALALLPQDTRIALIERYINEAPQAEIARQLGVSEGAVEAKLQRGKLTMRRVLSTEMREDALAYGLVVNTFNEDQETRIWCPQCGKHRLIRRSPQDTSQLNTYCPACDPEPDAFFAQTNWLPIFEGVKGTRPLLNRFERWVDAYVRPALSSGSLRCWRCKHITPLHLYLPPYVPPSSKHYRGVSVKCQHCRSTSYSTLYGIVLATPQGQKFRSAYQRIYRLPQREVEYNGRDALILGFQTMDGSHQLEVLFARDTYEILATFGGDNEQ